MDTKQEKKRDPRIVITLGEGNPKVELLDWKPGVPNQLLLNLHAVIIHEVHMWRNRQNVALLQSQPVKEKEDATQVRFS